MSFPSWYLAMRSYISLGRRCEASASYSCIWGSKRRHQDGKFQKTDARAYELTELDVMFVAEILQRRHQLPTEFSTLKNSSPPCAWQLICARWNPRVVSSDLWSCANLSYVGAKALQCPPGRENRIINEAARGTRKVLTSWTKVLNKPETKACVKQGSLASRASEH